MSYTWQRMIETETPARRADVERIVAAVRRDASRRPDRVGALAVLVGLPASGKSRVAEELRARTGAVVIESDALRRLLFRRRTYSAFESQRLFAAIHEAIEELLGEGISIVLDATNLTEAERAPLYEIAERAGAKLVIVQVTAPASLIRRRLGRRQAAGLSLSEAGIRVYERMLERVEEIERPHHTVDTSQKAAAELAKIAKEMTGT